MTDNNHNKNTKDDKNHIPDFDEIVALANLRDGGRSKCTTEMTLIIGNLLAKGMTVKDVCPMVGITQATYYNWVKRGRDERDRLESVCGEMWDLSMVLPSEAVYLEFFEIVKKAVPYRKLTIIDGIEQAGQDPTRWQALAWLGERLYPEDFGKRTTVKIETWQSEVIGLIKDGTISFKQLVNEVGEHESRKLFERAGARIPETV